MKYGGIELFFSLAYSVATPVTVGVITDTKIVAPFAPDDAGYDNFSLRIKINEDDDASGVALARCSSYSGSELVDSSDFVVGKTVDIGIVDIRVFLANNIVSVYVNDKWVYSFIMKAASYQADGYVDASVNAIAGGFTLLNLKRVELRDMREAVWVDYEATTSSAISSVIQQRPVEILPHQDRKLKFTYLVGKESIDATFVRSLDAKNKSNNRASVDGLVYGIDVGISTYTNGAEDIGFSTKLFRLSELDYGTIRAAKIIQEKEHESMFPVSLDSRFDPRAELGDIFSVTKTLSGTGREIREDVIIEDISFRLSDGKNAMSIRGRKNK